MIRKIMKLRKLRETAMSVSDNCIWLASVMSLVGIYVRDWLTKQDSYNEMRSALWAWTIGFLIMLPITGPLMLAGIIIGKVFVVQPLQDELMIKRNDPLLPKLSVIK